MHPACARLPHYRLVRHPNTTRGLQGDAPYLPTMMPPTRAYPRFDRAKMVTQFQPVAKGFAHLSVPATHRGLPLPVYGESPYRVRVRCWMPAAGCRMSDVRSNILETPSFLLPVTSSRHPLSGSYRHLFGGGTGSSDSARQSLDGSDDSAGATMFFINCAAPNSHRCILQ